MLNSPKKAPSVTQDKSLSFSPQIQQAIASLHLEGIKLSDASLADLLLFDNGELSKEDALKRVLDRVRSKAK